MNELTNHSLRGSFKILSALVLIVLVSLFANAQTGPGGPTYSESVLHTFTSDPDGMDPNTGLVSDSAGNFYGGTEWGGAYGDGSVFELTPNGSGGYTYTLIYSLTGGIDGAPLVGLTIDSQDNLYGWSNTGSVGYEYGNVFELSKGLDGNWILSKAYGFTGQSDGQYPTAALVDSSGNVYGTTHETYDGLEFGSFFELTTIDNQWFEQTNYSFTGADNGKHGEYPSTLAMDKKGNFYGVAQGNNAPLRIFRLHYSADKGWIETIVHIFQGGSDGGGPTANLTLGSDGNFYYGGPSALDGPGYGGVYKLTPSGKVTCLYAFTGGADGFGPADVTFDNAGNLYGVAGGGVVNQYCTGGCGEVYKLTRPSGGQATWTQNVLYSFTGGADGGQPVASLVVDDAGNVFGTTGYGGENYGKNGVGVVFKLTPNPVATTTTITKNVPNPSKTGQAVTVGFTVTQMVKANSLPTGTVTVNASTGESCISALPPNGKASCNLLFATAGTRTLTATYSGDSADLGSASNAVTQSTFNSTITTISKHAPDPAKVGQTVTVEFSVDAKDATKQTKPTGSVTVNASTGESCTGTLSGGDKGKCQLTFGSSGITTLTATYAGDADNEGSASKAVEQAVE